MEILESINRTIKYAQKYGGSLNEEQLFERLISNKIYKKEKVFSLIKKILRPAGGQGISLDREAFKKEQKAKELAVEISKKFKDILFLGITGSVAGGNPKKNSDIDLMIITKVNRLWLNRLKLRWFIKSNKLPHRKYGVKENEDEFCFNLWLDEESLKIRKEKQNLKNAVDLVLIKPLINKDKTYEKFILANDWAKKWVATGYSLKPTLPSLEKGGFKNNFLVDRVVNWLAFWMQFLYMKRKIKNEKVGLHEAYFHH